ncbi:MAG: polyprenyl synthetase family protein [Bacteroidales bacterium]|nr:polyprenyl synthetase family protein [Bacteroidales bacterium]
MRKGLMSLDFNREPQGLYEPVGYILGLGGKCLRPKLCLSAFSLFSDDITDEIVYPALALEIFHEFTLIHDDIMDRSDTRRNQPTVHVKWDDNTAILSGDAMSILAYRYLALCPAEKLRDAVKLFTDTALEVCEGQQKDMDFEEQPFVTMDEYLGMIGQKTGVLLACSAALGALLAGASEEQIKALWDFGYNTGLAFQITDDYLDTFGDPVTFGKPIGGDIANNKKSWLQVEAFHRAKASERFPEFSRLLALSEDKRAEKIAGMTRMYEELGVKEAASEAILECHAKAIEALEKGGLDAAQRDYMKEFAEKLIHRER